MNLKLVTLLSINAFFTFLIYTLYKFAQAVSPSILLMIIAGSVILPFILTQHFRILKNKKNLNRIFYFFLYGIIIITIFLFQQLSAGYIGNDEGSYIYESLLLNEGRIPLRDFISRAPFQLYFLTPFFIVLGFKIATLKTIVLSIYIFSFFFIYLILKENKGKFIALLGSVLIITNPVFFTSMLVLSTTNLSILLIIISFYLLQKDNRYLDIVNGIVLGCIFFTREIIAVYILLLIGYLIYKKTYEKLFRICLGGALVLTGVVLFFLQYISLNQIITTLFGIGHLGIQESRLSQGASLNIINMFIQSTLPFIMCLILFKKENFKKAIPFLIASSSFCIFYIFYFFKRGLFLTYAAETFIPFAIFVFLIINLDFLKNTLVPLGKKTTPIKLLLVCVSTFLIYSSVYTQKEITNPEKVTNLIGSNIPKSSFIKITEVIENSDSLKNKIILTGNLAIVTETGSRQFLDMSRPMAYQINSAVYELYNAKSKDAILTEFENNPPLIVVEDYHLRLSVWESIYPLVYSKYSVIYKDEYATVWKLN